MSYCERNQNRWFFGLFRDTGHNFKIFKIERCDYSNYKYDIHYKCEHCGVRCADDYVKENRDILDWIEQQKIIKKLKDNS